MAALPNSLPQNMLDLLASLPLNVRQRLWQQAMMESGGQPPDEAMINSLVTSYNREKESAGGS